MRRVPRSARAHSGTRRRVVVSQKQYVIITKKGLEFVSTIFSCAAPLAPEEIKFYGFLMRLVSFGGVLPLSSMKRWSLVGTLEGTVKKDYAKVTASRTELPKKEVQEVIKEIWGEMPKGLCV
jgi:hypothetical protein